MQTRLLQRKALRVAMFTASFFFVGFAVVHGGSQLINTKRITALQLGESAEGSRVTITGDSLLDEYEAFSRGDRFYVRIPAADFVASQPRFKGIGFEDVQVQKVGGSVVISFRLHAGATARVMETANRLEVIFASPNYFRGKSSAPVVRNSVTPNTRGIVTPSLSKPGSDFADSMPPDSSVTNTDYIAPGRASTRTPSPRTSQTAAAFPTNPASTNPATPTGTPMTASSPVSIATPYPTTYSATYPPASATYTPSVQPVAQTHEKYFALESRIRQIVRWLRTNKSVSTSVGVAALSLLGVVMFLLIRRRRNQRPVKLKASCFQSKFSPDTKLDDMMGGRIKSEPSKVPIPD